MNKSHISILFLILILLSSSAAFTDPLKRYTALAPEPAPLNVVLKDLEGDEIRLSDYKGKIIILNFWATWCMPCISEMPSLHELAKLYKHDNFVVIAVAKDEKGPITPKEFLKRTKFYQMTFAMDAEKGGLFEKLKVEGLPTTYVINEEGMIVGKLVGGTNWAHEDVLQLMQKYIEGDGPPPTPVSVLDRMFEWFEGIRTRINNLFKKEEEKELVPVSPPNSPELEKAIEDEGLKTSAAQNDSDGGEEDEEQEDNEEQEEQKLAEKKETAE